MDNKGFLAAADVYLRPLEERDAESAYPSWLNSEEVCCGNAHHTFPNTRQATRDYIAHVNQSREDLVLAVVISIDDQHIGNIALQNINLMYRSAEFAILIGDKKNWGKGYGEQAARLIINHGFKNLNLHRIYCGTFENNLGMQKLAQKLGMTQVGRQRQAAYKNGRYLDVIQYDLLASESELL